MKGGPDTESLPPTITEAAPEIYWKQGGWSAEKYRKNTMSRDEIEEVLVITSSLNEKTWGGGLTDYNSDEVKANSKEIFDLG